jgi:hypothetical protein
VGGNPGGGGGLGNVPNVGGGEEGGADRGGTNNFVRLTDYGGGGTEGGAGAGPDNGASDNSGGIGAKIAAATSSGGIGFAREIKANPRARGMGLMAYVGGFRDFCAEKRAMNVAACGAGTSSSGRAFRAPDADPVGNFVAQRVNAAASTNSAGPARGLTTVTK